MAEWLDKTDDFTAATGTWNGSAWVPALSGIYTLHLDVSGTWVGFRPTQVRVTFTGATAEGLSCFVRTSAPATLNDTTTFWTGFDTDSDLTTGTDIADFVCYAGDSFTVTKIEFYGDEVAEEEEEEEEVSVATPGTATSWSSRLRPGHRRGRKHFPLKTGSR